MKKLKYLLLIIVATLMSVISVKADENTDYMCDNENKICTFKYLRSTPEGLTPSSSWNDFDLLYKSYSDIIDDGRQRLINFYNSTYKDEYPYYAISLNLIQNSSSYSEDHLEKYFTSDNSYVQFSIYLFKSLPTFNHVDTLGYTDSINTISIPKFDALTPDYKIFVTQYTENEFTDISIGYNDNYIVGFNLYSIPYNASIFERYSLFQPLSFLDSNFQLLNNTGYTLIVPEYDNLIIKPNEFYFPIFYNGQLTRNQIEVNLDDYEYVILNLKDYNKKEAFETNLQVKGSIAITPVYEFGTTEKNEITDLCNTSYSEYTDYRFFILKNDLINNAVYIVKECQDSGSSFKFDSTMFDITYVTAENVDDPVITFGGVDYHTIPFNKLTNTVNKNEEEGFIPGESGSSLTDVINNITEYITSFWNSLTTFMSLVVKFFNTLPVEIRAISITTFTTACTLGLLKILKS